MEDVVSQRLVHLVQFRKVHAILCLVQKASPRLLLGHVLSLIHTHHVEWVRFVQMLAQINLVRVVGVGEGDVVRSLPLRRGSPFPLQPVEGFDRGEPIQDFPRLASLHGRVRGIEVEGVQLRNRELLYPGGE